MSVRGRGKVVGRYDARLFRSRCSVAKRSSFPDRQRVAKPGAIENCSRLLVLKVRRVAAFYTACRLRATLADRRLQNPVQAGTGDVHNPHTPLPRLPPSAILCRRATVIRHGLVSARRQAATTLHHGQERN